MRKLASLASVFVILASGFFTKKRTHTMYDKLTETNDTSPLKFRCSTQRERA